MQRRTVAILLVALSALSIVGCGGSGSGGQGGSGGNGSQNAITREFSLAGFTEVEIGNSFNFIVQQGDQFAIEVTVDADYIDLVSVSLDGIRLRIEFDPFFRGDIRSHVARGIITLPYLSAIELKGSAFADIAGFQASSLAITQSGNSHIVGSNNQLDYISASLDGSSHLMLTDIAPVPAAHVEVRGSSQATLDVMDSGTLTGSATGSSNVSYFGLLVNAQVSTLDSATVTWLGPSGN